MLFSLQYNITETSAYRFLERYSKIAQADSVLVYLAQYLLELALLDSKMAQYPPSLQASAALYVAMRVTLTDSLTRLGQDTSAANVSCWTQTLQEHTSYTRSDLRSCAEDYFQLAKIIGDSELKVVVKKFSQPKYLEVAQFMSGILHKQSNQRKEQVRMSASTLSKGQTFSQTSMERARPSRPNESSLH